MSSENGAGPLAPAGVVRSSALSFLAPAHPVGAGSSADGEQQNREHGDSDISQADRLLPAGLLALCEACTRLYPDQPNPMQITTRLKYWLGGNDPLDYISIYYNPGKPDEDIPPHWHYVSFGLSDLHGDGRVHPAPSSPSSPSGPSGYGFELTLRTAAEEHPAPGPPAWPAALLQALARYVFYTGNKLCAGDHIPWRRPLDGGPQGRVRHLLVAADPQLAEIRTAHGTVDFLQIVGCTGKELRAAQKSSGFEVLQRLRDDTSCGGSWLVSRVGRRRSARGLSLPAHSTLPTPRTPPAAQLAGVAARVRWQAWAPGREEQPESSLPPSLQQQIKDTLRRGLDTMGERSRPEGHMSTDSFEMSSLEKALPREQESAQEWWSSEEAAELPGAHLVLDASAASVLPLAINGRLRHGNHFTWRDCGRAVSLLAASEDSGGPGAKPYLACGAWLQVLVSKELAEEMSGQVVGLDRLAPLDSEDSDEATVGQPPGLPIELSWPEHGLKITVVADGELL